jgi:hypothetical protein
VLVLGDYHLIQAPSVHDSLAFLLDHLPRQLRLLASRNDPPLPLARLRARRQLAELRAAELRFTPEEAAALLREATGRELPAASVAALAARTAGWVAGLQLAALSLQGRSDPAEFVATFSGSHRYVLDFLTEKSSPGCESWSEVRVEGAHLPAGAWLAAGDDDAAAAGVAGGAGGAQLGAGPRAGGQLPPGGARGTRANRPGSCMVWSPTT